MFYSHEILTSRQYGVATIWLVATIGNRSGTRKVTRKAIQEVDVQRACGKILEPGAPIALRLQGNLLYGVSRVHNQQYTYLIADARKIQDQMKVFFNASSSSQLDPEAGKTRRENILIENDPAFDPKMPLPKFDLETLTSTHICSQKTSSQMSPQSSQLSGSHSLGQGFAIQLDIDNSSSLGHHGSPFGLEGLSSAQKPGDEPLIFHQDDDVFGVHGDWGLEIDEDGNIIESAELPMANEEPQLPPLPPTQWEDDMPANVAQFDEQPVFDNQGDVVMQENAFQDAEPFPERRTHGPWQDDEQQPARQALGRRKKTFQRDGETQLSRNVLRDWQFRYPEQCGSRARGPVSATRAKRNAMLLTFGLGIGNIGQSIGVPGLVHPLAVQFSGDVLFTTMTGIEVEELRGRRRTASEAIEDDEQQNERRVRPRMTKDEEVNEEARAAHEDDFMNLDDPFAEGIPQEVGREAEHPMSDHLSSTLLPWNRGSSAVPGSSARASRSVQQGRDLSSPLGKRGAPQDIVRYSDDAPMGDFGSDGNFGGGFGSADDSFDGMQAPDLIPETEPTAQEIQAQNDRLFAQLDKEGYNFMNFIQDAVNQDGERRRDEDFDINRKWLAFDDLFIPRVTPRSTATQAFYHTLCLATKDKIYVEQDEAKQKPFGAIWIGVKETAGNI
ncbi:putative sister chromatid cohesion protein [Xylaria flabelliformis]|nr:putative sister chromatid cohesion protein [Xylaria flabelliformis]